MYKTVEIESLLGETIVSIEGLSEGSYSVQFHTSAGEWYVMAHKQDCCETVYLADVNGLEEYLIGNPILMAEEVTHEPDDVSEYGEMELWTFYKFATIKGTVVLRWIGISNGYYSVDVDIERFETNPKGE